jgi:hypothetical protein
MEIIEKFIIEKELVDGFADIIKSEDGEGIKMALDIISNRDITHKESQKNFMEIMNKIIRDEVLFPKTAVWIVKLGGRILTCGGHSGFVSEKDARRQLSLHLTKLIGSNSKHHDYAYAQKRFTPYQWALRQVFKSGNNLRNFLIKNNLIEIVSIKY